MNSSKTIPDPFGVGIHRGPASPAVERALSRLMLLKGWSDDQGSTFPPIWRGVLVELEKEIKEQNDE